MTAILGVLVWTCLAGAADPGLVGCWDFDHDDAAGLLALDSSGNASHGHIHGAEWAPQGDGHALRFHGNGQYVDMGSPETLNITGPITLEAWVNPGRVPDAEPGIFGKSFGSYGLTYYKDGSCYWYVGGGGNKCSAPLATGLWVHLAGTFDGETLCLYLNGALADTAESQFDGMPSDTSFQIGRIRANAGSDVPTAGFPGLVDGVRVYGRALTAGEVLDHYNAEAAQYGGPSASNEIALAAYPCFEEQRIYADLDCSRLFPRPKAVRATVALLREGDAGPGEAQEFTLTQDSLVLRDAVFEVAERGSYTLVAQVEEAGQLRAGTAVLVPFPASFEVPGPDQEMVPPLDSPPVPLACRVTLHERGGFSVEAGGSHYRVASTYSWPHGGFNAFSPGEDVAQNPEPVWHAAVDTHGAYTARGEGAFYRIERRVEPDGHRVWVKDTITNLTDAPLGILLSNYLDLNGHGAVSCSPVPNPSIFASVDGQGIGLVALDDVYLEHYATYFESGAAGIRDHTFALDAGASYTLEWAVYVNATGDYYDFINDVRRDLGVNRRIAGSFAFIDRREAPAREYVERRGLAYVSVGCLGHPPDNPGLSLEGVEFVSYPQEMALLKELFAETRERFPGIQTMFHIAHSLYTTNTPGELFPDARVVDAGGQQTMYGGDNPEYYARYFSKEHVDAGYRWYIFYPTMTNSFGKAMPTRSTSCSGRSAARACSPTGSPTGTAAGSRITPGMVTPRTSIPKPRRSRGSMPRLIFSRRTCWSAWRARWRPRGASLSATVIPVRGPSTTRTCCTVSSRPRATPNWFACIWCRAPPPWATTSGSRAARRGTSTTTSVRSCSMAAFTSITARGTCLIRWQRCTCIPSRPPSCTRDG